MLDPDTDDLIFLINQVSTSGKLKPIARHVAKTHEQREITRIPFLKVCVHRTVVPD